LVIYYKLHFPTHFDTLLPMPTRQEDENNLQKIRSSEPRDILKDNKKTAQTNLDAHIAEHQCNDKCSVRRNLEAELGRINAALSGK